MRLIREICSIVYYYIIVSGSTGRAKWSKCVQNGVIYLGSRRSGFVGSPLELTREWGKSVDGVFIGVANMYSSIKKTVLLSAIFSVTLFSQVSTVKSASWVENFFGERFLERLAASAKISGADLLSTGAHYSAQSAFRDLGQRGIVDTFNRDGVAGVMRLMAEYGIRLTPAFILRMFGIVGEEDGRASLAQARRRINHGERVQVRNREPLHNNRECDNGGHTRARARGRNGRGRANGARGRRA